MKVTLPPLGEGAHSLQACEAGAQAWADEGLEAITELTECSEMDQSPKTLARARSLRHTQTEAEKRLWGYLRDRRLSGHKFRRQVPIPPYIADFACIEHKFIVEVDGATHGDDHQVRHDEARTAFLSAKGFRVHRVQSLDVFNSIDDALDGILLALRKP